MKFVEVLEKFNKMQASDIVAVKLDEKVELGLNLAGGAASMGLGLGTFKLISKIADPVIEAEPKLPVRIAYKTTKYFVSSAVSACVQTYVSTLFNNAKVALKAKKILDAIKEEEENGTDTEQVCEA